MFEKHNPQGFNLDDAILRHELGHALTWYYNGGAVGRILLERRKDGFLQGRSLLVQHPMHTKLSNATIVERLLAGEAAARKFLGLRRDIISIPTTCRDDGSRLVWSPEDKHEDILKAYHIALDEMGANWKQWMKERLKKTCAILDFNWETIDEIATDFTDSIPTKRTKVNQIWGFEILSKFSSREVVVDKKSIIEVIKPTEKGGINVQIRRKLFHLKNRSILYIVKNQ